VEEERPRITDYRHVTRQPTEDRALLGRDCEDQHDQRQDPERMWHAERPVPENEKAGDAGGDGQEDIDTAGCGRKADLAVLRQRR